MRWVTLAGGGQYKYREWRVGARARIRSGQVSRCGQPVSVLAPAGHVTSTVICEKVREAASTNKKGRAESGEDYLCIRVCRASSS